MPHPFILFGRPHLAALAPAFVLPVLLALWARGRGPRDKYVRWSLAAILIAGWIGWYGLFAMRGWLTPGNALPLNLCDWAAVALIIALLGKKQLAYELGYFWGLGGTLQGLITPDIAFDFPDPQFFFFFLQHSGVIACLLYLTLGTRLRSWPSTLPRVIGASFVYAGVAGMADWLVGTNYGFLRAKPHNASLIDLLSPWPWYIPELVAIGVFSALFYYLPFALLDLSRPYRARARGTPSRITSDKGPSG